MGRNCTSGQSQDSFQRAIHRHNVNRQTAIDLRASQHSVLSDSFSHITPANAAAKLQLASELAGKTGWLGDRANDFVADFSVGGGGGERHLASVGTQALQQQQQKQMSSTKGGFGSMLDRFFYVFARRSRRKESDKASSIQQHLRAIRHAENLDRQTHFRHSRGKFYTRKIQKNLTL